jgi:hypothetical protein
LGICGTVRGGQPPPPLADTAGRDGKLLNISKIWLLTATIAHSTTLSRAILHRLWNRHRNEWSAGNSRRRSDTLHFQPSCSECKPSPQFFPIAVLTNSVQTAYQPPISSLLTVGVAQIFVYDTISPAHRIDDSSSTQAYNSVPPVPIRSRELEGRMELVLQGRQLLLPGHVLQKQPRISRFGRTEEPVQLIIRSRIYLRNS